MKSALWSCGLICLAAQAVRSEQMSEILKANRFQIGDLVFQIPQDQKVTRSVPGDYSGYSPERLDTNARQVGAITIDGPDAWKPSGTHSRASGPEGSRIQIVIWQKDRGNEVDYWCHKPPFVIGGRYLRPENALGRTQDFYIYGDAENKAEMRQHALIYGKFVHKSRTLVAAGNQTFFFAPVVIRKSDVGSGERPYFDYYTYIALSNHAAIDVRFDDGDIKDISILDLLRNVERNVMSWRAPEPFSPNVYAHQNPSFCAD